MKLHILKYKDGFEIGFNILYSPSMPFLNGVHIALIKWSIRIWMESQ